MNHLFFDIGVHPYETFTFMYFIEGINGIDNKINKHLLKCVLIPQNKR